MDEYGMRIPTPSDEWRKAPAKKDTKRWCKGHVGREHQPVVELSKWPYSGLRERGCRPIPEDDRKFFWLHDKHGFICYHQVNCSACGKRLQETPERCPLNVG